MSKEVPNLAPTHADVAGRHIGFIADIAVQLGHKGLAEQHHFVVGLAVRVEVGPTLAPADTLVGQRVLENLFESQELDDVTVDGFMEAQPAFVRPQRRVEFDAVTPVDLHFAFVVHPRHAENNLTLGFGQALQQTVVGVLRMLFDNRVERLDYLGERLQELGFARIPRRGLVQYFFKFRMHEQLPSLNNFYPWIILRFVSAF